MSQIIHAQKGDLRTEFSVTAWRKMGKNRNGWEQVPTEGEDNSQVEAELAAAKQQIGDKANVRPLNGPKSDSEYQKLTDQAKGFEKDGKMEDALARYREAQAIKDSSYIKGKINSLQALVDAENDPAPDAYAELVETADAAFEDEDYDTALETYLAAQELRNTDHVAGRIKASQEALA